MKSAEKIKVVQYSNHKWTPKIKVVQYSNQKWQLSIEAVQYSNHKLHSRSPKTKLSSIPTKSDCFKWKSTCTQTKSEIFKISIKSFFVCPTTLNSFFKFWQFLIFRMAIFAKRPKIFVIFIRKTRLSGEFLREAKIFFAFFAIIRWVSIVPALACVANN